MCCGLASFVVAIHTLLRLKNAQAGHVVFAVLAVNPTDVVQQCQDVFRWA